jgi:uncharacterized membrane protein (UPF0127 family)
MHSDWKRMMSLSRSLAVSALLALATATAAPALAQTQAQPALPTTRLTANIHVITAELATTPQARSTGMMFRERIEPNHGMLFVFENKEQHCFWMRNTLLPLSIAFIADDGTIVNIEEMKSRDESSTTCPKTQIRYALEMEKGWFAKRGIAPGSKVGGLPAARSNPPVKQ